MPSFSDFFASNLQKNPGYFGRVIVNLTGGIEVLLEGQSAPVEARTKSLHAIYEKILNYFVDFFKIRKKIQKSKSSYKCQI